MKTPKIIYFLNDGVPTEEERAEAESLGFPVAWRNARFIDHDAAPEDCDGVMGAVPESYAHINGPEVALNQIEAEKQALREKVGDDSPLLTDTVKIDETKNPAIKPAAKSKKETKAAPAAWGAN